MTFRSYRLRLLAAMFGLTAIAELVAFFFVARVHRLEAEREIAHQLAVASDQFTRVVAQRTADLARSAAALSWDKGLRQTLSTTTDSATLRSALDSFRGRVDAGLVALIDLQGHVLAETRAGSSAEAVYRPLFETADNSSEARANGFGIIDTALYSLAIVPLRSPDVVAWIAIGFPLDAGFVAHLKQSTGVEITIARGDAILATTVTKPARFLPAFRRVGTTTGEPAVVTLQYSLDEKLAPARRLEAILAAIFVGSLLLASIVALRIAQGISRPVQELAAHARRVGAGDYAARTTVDRADELGQLATAFNEMAAGLAERDRIRDLLDKNVSPEVAAQMLRDGAALGGEEREVTVLFSDLRGFTTLSEKLPAPALLALLNRYLDRMSGEIERHGGVIDKVIGDAIMALFGAPVKQADSADRAVAAALAMEHALAALNRELAAEGHPTLALGIGINTAPVVAGNIGSHRRLNYSVIGDGVNVAARLQSLTRDAAYRTNIVTSVATRAAVRDTAAFCFRPLGSVQVKGRSGAVEIYAVDRTPDPTDATSTLSSAAPHSALDRAPKSPPRDSPSAA